MGEITELLQLDWTGVLSGMFLIAFGIKGIIELISYYKHKLRIKTGREISTEQLNERISTLEKHDNWQYSEITKISECVQDISNQLTTMKRALDETEMAKLNEIIVNCYNKYKDVGEWTALEKEAFWNIFKRYEAHGGNGFVHSIVEPVMRQMKVKD